MERAERIEEVIATLSRDVRYLLNEAIEEIEKEARKSVARQFVKELKQFKGLKAEQFVDVWEETYNLKEDKE